ncbi:PREDICTED: M569_00896 partial [Prunus dulcis]|uniref:PREDICTED: M569_00896 partial n=1 Tax=Prunus dulcis TaxID=3755 RepID=A0A5E4GBX0_PRUDU|nr:PREDICTED: M569_00896 partial [Prunus dulcis]
MDKGSEHIWNSLSVVRELLFRGARWQVMHGNCINMWSDTCPVPQHAPIVVADLMDRHGHTCDLSKIKAFISPLDVQAIMAIPISNFDIPNRFIWPYTMNGR